MKFPQYVSSKERTVSVVGYLDKKNDTKEECINKYKDGKGYIDDDEYIWIYCAEGKPKNKNAYPYFWINENGEKEFSDPPEIIKKAYSTEYMVDMGLVNIIDNTKEGEQLYDEKEINDMNAAASFFVPIINENDDFLKKIVKSTIIEKGIDINRLKGKTDEKYMLPNMKADLINSTKMSVMYFCCWMNLLGCDFEISIMDDGNKNKSDPLKTPIVYQSYKDGLSKIVNNELVELNTGSYAGKSEDENND